ncbi:hypothetical protein M407DRAFT_34456, partial [Tulasnella calospora MUT 4182]
MSAAKAPKVRLRPTLPSQSGHKYSGPLGSQIPIQPEGVVPTLSFVGDSHPSGPDVEPEWISFIHPDGNKYYWQERLKIVSSSDASQAYYDTVFRHARNIIEDLARAQNANVQDAEAFFL